MKTGSVIRIPDAGASRAGGRELVQPGLPGRWSVWSQAGAGPGTHFVIPASEDARATGVKFATVRITARILLLATDPAGAMPKPRRAA